MKEEAKNQLKPITVYQIKETLKKVVPDTFDKMIIAENQPINRFNFIYVRLKYQKVERIVEKIKFPFYGSLKDKFAELEGGSKKLGEKIKMPSETIIEVLRNSYSKTGLPILNADLKAPFVFPVDAENNEVSLKQSKYIFPDLTYSETCDQCYGHKYINCHDSECNGRHIWTCTNCSGKGILACEKCGGKKKVNCPNCSGTSRIKCRRCGGDGKVNDGILAKTIFSKLVKEKICGDCAGKGYVPCKACKNGTIACKECRGIGKVICPECESQGTVTCMSCYSDHERFGKINCPQCQTEGVTAQIVYVKTNVSSGEIDKIIVEGSDLTIGENQIKSHINQDQKAELIYKKVNNEITENYNEYNRIYANNIEKDLGLYKGDFPMLTKEEIYYQVIPCVELSYKHILTNTTHEFTILDFWSNPEIIFHSEPEQLKKSIGNSAKLIKGSISKLFKTKGYKRKKDLRNEIVLLIYLIKADGTIKEEEKTGISEMIVSLKDFTNSEKQKLYDFMNTSTLPALTKADVIFSTKERGQEVLNKLSNLASADGEIAEEEKALLEKINSLI
jgi:uncharacterized tellurite resistance protein B-like protein